MCRSYFVFAILFLVSPIAAIVAPAQDQAAGNKKAEKLCVALQHQYEPETISAQLDPKQFFTFPFDLALQDAPAADVDYSPDGKCLAFGMGWFNQGGWLAVWDLENDKEKFAVWLGLGIRTVQYSPDGKTIAVACFDQSAKIFDAESGKQLATLPLSNTNGTNSVSFSPNGNTIATGGLHAFVILWDTKTYREKMRLKGHGIRIYCAMYSPDGTMIASVDKKGLGIVWDATTGEEISRLQGHQDGIESVEFTRDSQYVITAGWDGSVRFWDPQTGEENEDLRHVAHQGAMCLATSPDGTYVASSGFGDVIELFDYQNDQTIRFQHGCQRQMYGLCFSPDGKEFASANFDGSIKRWSTDKQQLIDRIDMKDRGSEDRPSAPLAVAWSSDGRTIVSGHEDGSVRIRDPVSGSIRHRIDAHDAEVAAIAISKDGRRLASCGCDHVVHIWNLVELNNGRNVDSTKLQGHTDWVVAGVFSPDGKWLATGSIDKTIRIWNAETGERVQLLTNHKTIVRSVDFSPDGKWLVSGEDKGTVIRWDTASWSPKNLMRRNKFRCARFSPSGDRVAIGFEVGGLRIFETRTWQETKVLEKTFGLTSIDWSPRGQLLIVGNLRGKIMLRDAESGESIKTFGQHGNSITSVDFAPSGNAFVSGSVDKRLCRWNAILTKVPVEP